MRVTNQWINNSFVNQINKVNSSLSDLQLKVSSGLNYLTASENVSANSIIMQYKTEIAENTQYITNSDNANDWLTNTDSALTSLESVIQRARELALQGAQDTNVEVDFDAMAAEIDELLNYIVDLSNTNVTGNYIFSGESVTTQTVTASEGSDGNYNNTIITTTGEVRENINLTSVMNVSYNGNSTRMVSEIDTNTVVEKSITGLELLYGESSIASTPGYTTAIPPLEESINLSVLNDGNGVQGGIITLTDQNGVEHDIDLSSANRIDDVLFLINDTGSFEAGLEEVSSDTAVALGLCRNAGYSNTLIGLSDPAMLSESTELTNLNNGQGVPDGVLNITTRDGSNYRVDLSSCTTVGDVVTALNNVGGGAVLDVRYNMVDKNIEIQDVTGGTGELYINSTKTQLYITDLEPHTAEDLGLVDNVGAANVIYSGYDVEIESEASPLEFMNDGNGVEAGYINITSHDGTVTTVDLTTAQTPADIVDAINTAAAAAGVNVTAEFDVDSKRVKITDNTTGTGDFRIDEVYGTLPVTVSENQTVAKNLGLLKSTKGNTVVGDTLVSGGGAVSETTLLSDLIPPPEAGIMVIKGGDGEAVEVDLYAAETVQDVLDAVNENTVFEATWDSAESRIIITDPSAVGGNYGLTVEEQTNTARDLGLIEGTSNHVAGTLTGAPISVEALPTLTGSVDLNPAVTRETTLESLNSDRSYNTGVNLGYIRITDKAGNFKAIDLRGCTTVGDVMDKINDPANGIYVEATLNSDGSGISIIDKNNGASGKLEVISINCTAASDLGIAGRTVDNVLVGTDINPALTETTPVSALNGGKGLELGELYIQSGSYSATVDLSGCKNVGEVIDKLSNTDNNLNLEAWISADGKSLNLTNTAGEAYIKVRDASGSGTTCASGLGLGSSPSIFTTLMDLRDNLLRGDVEAISNETLGWIDEDLERVLDLHSEVGSKVNRVTFTKEKHQTLSLNLTNMLSSVEDIDISSAIIEMTEQETAYQASLSVGAKLMQMSLLDFLS